MTPFHPLALEDYERYRRYYDRCRDKSADYSFINMWGWNDKYHFELDYDDDLCWICSRGRHHCHMYSPIGKWQQENWPQRMSLFSEGCLKFHRIPENLAGQIKKDYPGRIFIKEDRGNWEYIYDAAELTALSGQKYRSKRKAASNVTAYIIFSFNRMSFVLFVCKETKKIGIIHPIFRYCNPFA